MANIFMTNLEWKAISSATLKPKIWLHYVDDWINKLIRVLVVSFAKIVGWEKTSAIADHYVDNFTLINLMKKWFALINLL